MLALRLSEISYTGKRQSVHIDWFGGLCPLESLQNHGKTSDSSDKLQEPRPLRPGSEYFLFCRFFGRILPLKRWPRSSEKFYIRANDSPFTSTDLAVFVHLNHFEETARRPTQVTTNRGRVPLGQEANIFCFALSFLEYCPWNVGQEAQRNFIYGQTTDSSHRLIWRFSSTWVTSKPRQDVPFKWQITGPRPLRPGIDYFFFCRFFCRILPLKCWPWGSVKFYIRANDSPFTSNLFGGLRPLESLRRNGKTSDSSDKLQGPSPLRPGSEYFFCFAVSFVEYCSWNVGLEAQWNFIYG